MDSVKLSSTIDISSTNRKPINTWKCNSASNYKKVKLVGRGAFGLVYKATQYNTKEEKSRTVALKQIKTEGIKEGFPTTALREIAIMRHLKHPNIIELEDIVYTPPNDENKNQGTIYLVFPYMEHELTGLYEANVSFTVPQIKNIMYQILLGMQYLHDMKIIHRDIKSGNILYNNIGEVKIGDFGLARVHNPTNINKRYTQLVVTLWYRAPEILLGLRQYNQAVDMWSIACVFAELFNGGNVLFRGKDDDDQLRKIFEKCGTPNEKEWPGVTKLSGWGARKINTEYAYNLNEEFKKYQKLDELGVDLLKKMLSLDPSKRISAKEALEHEYFKTEPLMCRNEELPRFENESHEYRMRWDNEMLKQISCNNKLMEGMDKQIIGEEFLKKKRVLPDDSKNDIKKGNKDADINVNNNSVKQSNKNIDSSSGGISKEHKDNNPNINYTNHEKTIPN